MRARGKWPENTCRAAADAQITAGGRAARGEEAVVASGAREKIVERGRIEVGLEARRRGLDGQP